MNYENEQKVVAAIHKPLSQRMIQAGLPWELARDVIKALDEAGFDIVAKVE